MCTAPLHESDILCLYRHPDRPDGGVAHMIGKLVKTGGLILMALGLFSACTARKYIIGTDPKLEEITYIHAGGGGMDYFSSWNYSASKSLSSGRCTMSARMYDEEIADMKEVNTEITAEEYESILKSVEGLKYAEYKPDAQVMDGYSESAGISWGKRVSGNYRIEFGNEGMRPLITAFRSVLHAHPQKQLDVTLSMDHAWIFAQWDSAEEECTYEVTLYSRAESTEGEVAMSALSSFETGGTSEAISDRIAYYCQEYNTDTVRNPIDLVVGVKAVKDNLTVASGLSDLLSLKYFFPPSEAPVLKEDIALEDIVLFKWNSSGSSMENIFSFYADMSSEPALYSYSYFSANGYTEDEKEVSQDFCDRLREYIGRGKLYRRHVMDPDIHELDGGEKYFHIEWNGMDDGQRRYYRIEFDEEDEAELTAFLKENAQ